MARLGGTLFEVDGVSGIAPFDFDPYGTVGGYATALEWLPINDTKGIENAAGIPISVGNFFKVNISDNNGAASNGATISSVSYESRYSQQSAAIPGNHLVAKPTINSIVRDPQSGDAIFENTSGAFDATIMGWTTNPATGLAWSLADIISVPWGVEVTSIVGAAPTAYFQFSRLGVFVVYTPTAAVAFVDPPTLATGTAGQSITIHGDSFIGDEALVIIGGSLATNVVIVNQDEITCEIPTLGDGFHSVTVTMRTGGTNNGNLLALTDTDGLEIGTDIEITGSGGVEISGSADSLLTGGALTITGSGGVEVGGSAELVLSVDISGIYQLTTNLRHDVLYARDSGEDTLEVKIPDLRVKLAYLGS